MSSVLGTDNVLFIVRKTFIFHEELNIFTFRTTLLIPTKTNRYPKESFPCTESMWGGLEEVVRGQHLIWQYQISDIYRFLWIFVWWSAGHSWWGTDSRCQFILWTICISRRILLSVQDHLWAEDSSRPVEVQMHQIHSRLVTENARERRCLLEVRKMLLESIWYCCCYKVDISLRRASRRFSGLWGQKVITRTEWYTRISPSNTLYPSRKWRWTSPSISLFI